MLLAEIAVLIRNSSPSTPPSELGPAPVWERPAAGAADLDRKELSHALLNAVVVRLNDAFAVLNRNLSGPVYSEVAQRQGCPNSD